MDMNNENAEGDASNQDVGTHIVNACVKWARIRGYSDSAGYLRGLAILAKEPLSLDDLVQETGYSKSTISSNMSLLENLRLVERIVIPGDKRHLYAPITDPEIIRTNMLDAITKEMQIFCEALYKTESNILAGRDEAKAKHLLVRIASLKQSYELGTKMIDFLRKQSLDEVRKSLE